MDGDQTNNDLVGAGAMYVFQRQAGHWSQEAYLKASNTGAQDFFGQGVAISGSTVLGSSHWEDSIATGVNGDQADESAEAAGAAYVFELAATCGVTSYGPTTGANFAKLRSYTEPLEIAKFVFELSEFQSTGLAFLMVSTAPANMPFMGGTLLVDPSLSIFGPNGVVFLLLPAYVTHYQTWIPAGLGGLAFYAQAGMLDAGNLGDSL